MFSSYASEEKVRLEAPLPDDVNVLLKWKCSIGKFKGLTYGYCAAHYYEGLKQLLTWVKLDERTREIIIRVLAAYDAWASSDEGAMVNGAVANSAVVSP